MPPAETTLGDGIHCRLDELLRERDLTLVQLSERVGVSVVNLSVLKNGHARAVRFSTLKAICDTLGCDVGDLLTLKPAAAVTAE
jgi:putative transcriptional regulator